MTNITDIRHAMPVSAEINKTTVELDTAVAKAIDVARTVGLPQGLAFHLAWSLPYTDAVHASAGAGISSKHTLKTLSVEPFAFCISLYSGWIASLQPALIFIVINVETYRVGRAVEARSAAC